MTHRLYISAFEVMYSLKQNLLIWTRPSDWSIMNVCYNIPKMTHTILRLKETIVNLI